MSSSQPPSTTTGRDLRAAVLRLLAVIAGMVGAAIAGVLLINTVNSPSSKFLAPVDVLHLRLGIGGLLAAGIAVWVCFQAARWERHGFISYSVQRKLEALVLSMGSVVSLLLCWRWAADYQRRVVDSARYVWFIGYLVSNACGLLSVLRIRRWTSGRPGAGWSWLVSLAYVAASTIVSYGLVMSLLLGAMLLGLLSLWGGAPGVETGILAATIVLHQVLQAVVTRRILRIGK